MSAAETLRHRASPLRAYDRASAALALGLAGATLVFVFAAVIWDVTIRALGLQPPVWTSAGIEYAMLVLTMAIAPWLVRSRANVRIEILPNALPPRARQALSRVIDLTAAATCLLVAVTAIRMGFDSAARGEVDIRAIELPRWVLFALLAGGFGLCAAEFLRHAFGPAEADKGRHP